MFNNNIREYIAIRSGKQIIDNLSQIIISPEAGLDNSEINKFAIDLSEKYNHLLKQNLSQNDCKEFTLNFSKRYNFSKLNKIQIIDQKSFNDYRNSRIKESRPLFDSGFFTRKIQSSKPKTIEKPKIIKKPKTIKKLKSSKKREFEVSKFESKDIKNCFESKIRRFGFDNNPFELNYETTLFKNGNIFYVAMKSISNDFEELEILLKIMTSKIPIFNINSANSLDPNSIWSLLSNEMLKNGYMKWSPRKCRDSYFCAISLYEMV